MTITTEGLSFVDIIISRELIFRLLATHIPPVFFLRFGACNSTTSNSDAFFKGE